MCRTKRRPLKCRASGGSRWRAAASFMGGFTSKKSVADAGFERLEGKKRMWDAKNDTWIEEPVNLMMLSEHFAKGAMRLVYRAWELKPGVKDLSEDSDPDY